MIATQDSDNCVPVTAQETMSANADYLVRLPPQTWRSFLGPMSWLRRSAKSD
jgi:hypothetical protein